METHSSMVVREALEVARALTVDTGLRSGYSIPNAVLAVTDLYGLTDDEAASIRRMLERAAL